MYVSLALGRTVPLCGYPGNTLTIPRGEEPEVQGDDPRKGGRVHGACRETQAASKSERRHKSQEAFSHGREWQVVGGEWEGWKVRTSMFIVVIGGLTEYAGMTKRRVTPSPRSSVVRLPALSSLKSQTSDGKT
jgi:hypothetical protein